MSYGSENKFPAGTRIRDVREFVELLGYKKVSVWRYEGDTFESYFWFDETDYKSWAGVELTVYIDREDGLLAVSTRSVVARSYYDLVHQNETISSLRKRFGGYFSTDGGRGRYWRPEFGPPPPAASGCHLAHSRFGSNLIKVLVYLQAVSFPEEPKGALLQLMQDRAPRVLSNNMAISFLVSIMEDYLKSAFVALLTYSPSKEKFLRGVRLQGEQLARIANGDISVEGMVAETLSFQRASAACRHFQALDNELDLAGALKRPFRRRQISLFAALEKMVELRHDFVHRAKLDLGHSTQDIIQIVYDLDVAVDRINRAFVTRYNWPAIERSWYLGRCPRAR